MSQKPKRNIPIARIVRCYFYSIIIDITLVLKGYSKD